MLALATLPFELAAGVSVGPLTLTNVELLISGALGLWLALLAAERRAPAVPRWLAGCAAVLVSMLLLSAALAADERSGAIRFALRQGQGALLALCIADTLRRSGGAGRLAGALLAGAGLSAALGLVELSEAPAALALLAPFKSESTYMGGLIRLSATFSYANTAAQYYEALLPLSVLLLIAGDRGQGTGDRGAQLGRRSPQVNHEAHEVHEGRAAAVSASWPSWFKPSGHFHLSVLVLGALLVLATLFTYSRAALLVTALLLLLLPVAAGLSWGRAALGRIGLACLGLLAVIVGVAAASPTFRLRVSEPEVANWYSARYQPAPLATLAPNELRPVPITLRNSGRIAWDHAGTRPVRLAYHWIDATTGQIVRFEGRRTPLPHTIQPGAAVALIATVQAPERPGRYILAWDMLREYIGRGWFSQMGVPPARVAVVVGGVPSPGVKPPPSERPAALSSIMAQPGPPGRRALWGVALELWRERPLLGIGPDVFRHIYGPRLGLTLFDSRVHTNNLYLELLTGAGVLGLGAFLALIACCLWAGWRALTDDRRPTTDDSPPETKGAVSRIEAWSSTVHRPPSIVHRPSSTVLLGALLGIVAFLAHGMLDVFLAFTPTYALLWSLIGIVAGLTAGAGERSGHLATYFEQEPSPSTNIPGTAYAYRL